MIDQAFALAVITSDMIDGAIGLFMVAMGVCALIFPCLFVPSPYGEGYRRKARWRRVFGAFWILVGISIFAARHQSQGTFTEMLFPRASSVKKSPFAPAPSQPR
jgi:hypothetical protein